MTDPIKLALFQMSVLDDKEIETELGKCLKRITYIEENVTNRTEYFLSLKANTAYQNLLVTLYLEDTLEIKTKAATIYVSCIDMLHEYNMFKM